MQSLHKLIIQRDFDPNIAKELGTDSAIILQNFIFWVATNTFNDKNFRDNQYWTYNSYPALQKFFPYLTERQIRHCIDKLIQAGYLIRGEYNKANYDKTSWYTISEKCHFDLTILSDGDDNSVRPIPDDKPDDKPISEEEPIDNDLNLVTPVRKADRVYKISSGYQRPNPQYKKNNYPEQKKKGAVDARHIP